MQPHPGALIHDSIPPDLPASYGGEAVRGQPLGAASPCGFTTGFAAAAAKSPQYSKRDLLPAPLVALENGQQIDLVTPATRIATKITFADILNVR